MKTEKMLAEWNAFVSAIYWFNLVKRVKKSKMKIYPCWFYADGKMMQKFTK